MRKTIRLSIILFILISMFTLSSCGKDEHIHEFDEGKIIKEATCSETGIKEYKCNSCDEVKQDIIEKIEHTIVTLECIRATCDEEGLTEGKYCSVCNEVIRKQEVIKKQGHDYVDYKCTKCGDVKKHSHKDSGWIIKRKATCTNDGYRYQQCSSCKEILKEEVIKATGHYIVTKTGKKATCLEDGKTEGSYCSICYEDIVKQEVVKALGHTEVIDKGIEDTCESIGLTEGSHCSVCDEVLKKQEIIDDIKHQYEKGFCIHCKKSMEDKTPTKNLRYILNSDGKSYSVLGLILGSTDSEIVIAKTYEGLPVTKICNNAFSDEKNIKTIIIPSTIINIGEYAFGNCENLEYVYIPNSVTNIEQKAFERCKKLKTVELPQNIETISYGLFIACDGLTSIVIPEGVKEIESRAFEGCIYLSKVTIPQSVTIINSEAFYSCLSLEEVIIKENSKLKTIDYQAFDRCEKLRKIEIPSGVEKIGHEAFGNCIRLEKIIIPKSVIDIGSYAFIYCEKLTIYCEVESNLESWSSYWNYSKCDVVWGYTE